MQMPTSDQVNSALRHVYTATGTTVAVLVMVGLSQGDATSIGNAVHQIGDGVASIIAGVSALIPVASALYAAWTASPFSKLMNMKKNPEIAKVEAVPGTPTAALADAIPGNKITTAAKAAIVLLAIGLASLAFAPSAMAQTTAPTKRAPAAAQTPSDCLPLDPRPACQNGLFTPGTPGGTVTLTGNISKDMQSLWLKIIALSNADLSYASALAGSANTNSSKVRKQCFDAIIALNQQANGANLKDASGNPLPKPDPSLFTDVEQLAEVIDNLSPQGPLFTSCAGAAQLARTSTLQFIGAVVTGVAGVTAIAPIIP